MRTIGSTNFGVGSDQDLKNFRAALVHGERGSASLYWGSGGIAPSGGPGGRASPP